MELYSVEKKLENFYLILENYAPDFCLSMGLIIGEKKAALIDSGMGMYGEELKDIVADLTDKPVINILTHGHPDHIAGSVLFQEVFMNERDDSQIPRLKKEKRMGDTEVFSRNNDEIMRIAEERCLDCSGFQYKNTDAGDIFDLGNVKLEIMALPGHSQGSIAILNKEDGYVMVGDAFSNRVPASSVTDPNQFKVMADRISLFIEETENMTMYGGHSREPIDRQIVMDEMMAARELGEGKTTGDEDIYIQISPVPNQKQHTYGSVGITYNPELFR